MRNLTPQEQEDVLAAVTLVKGGDFAVVKEILKFNQNLKEYEERVTKAEEKVDEAIEAASTIIKGQQGEKGDAYILTEEDKTQIAEQVKVPAAEKIIEKVTEKVNIVREVVDTEAIASEAAVKAQETLMAMMPTLDSLAKDVTKFGMTTRDALETLKDEERLDISAIKGLDKNNTALTTDIINRAIGIIDQRTSYLINKVSDLAVRVANGTGGGASTFIALTDVPSSYAGEGQKFVKVKATEDGLEFVAGSGAAVAWGDITGTLSDQTDLQTALDAKQDEDATLTALAAYNTNGLITQTSADTFTGRTLTGTANKITVSNGDGVAGNPTVTIPDGVVLVAPVLGTPASGTVTNLTGTASININGTVGATTPTTIVGTTITANTSLLPDADDGAVLGAAGTAFSDLFLAEGGVINWDSGDATITQTGNVLAVAGADLRVATADVGTNADSVPTLSSTSTLTNKTLTTPTIADFTNAQHDHSDADDGGQLGDSAISSTADVMIRSIGITIDGGGSAITTGIKGYIEVPYNCTINRVTMLADQSGSAVVDIWKDTYANFPPTDADTITASAVPTISTATKSQDATLTGWTTTITAGDILGFNVDSASTITRLHLILKVTIT